MVLLEGRVVVASDKMSLTLALLLLLELLLQEMLLLLELLFSRSIIKLLLLLMLQFMLLLLFLVGLCGVFLKTFEDSVCWLLCGKLFLPSVTLVLLLLCFLLLLTLVSISPSLFVQAVVLVN